MTAPKGKTEAERALAFGALIRKLRREHKLTLNQLAERVPMSASNLSRIELGAQGPPADEVIERIATALDAESTDLLRAGRSAGQRQDLRGDGAGPAKRDRSGRAGRQAGRIWRTPKLAGVMPDPSPELAAFGRAVRAIRKERGVSQVQLAEAT